MATYKLAKFGVLDTVANRSIPNDAGNRHWQEYQQWLADGNVPDPADVVVPVTDQDNAAGQMLNDPLFRGLIKELAARFAVTPAQLMQSIKARV